MPRLALRGGRMRPGKEGGQRGAERRSELAGGRQGPRPLPDPHTPGAVSCSLLASFVDVTCPGLRDQLLGDASLKACATSRRGKGAIRHGTRSAGKPWSEQLTPPVRHGYLPQPSRY